MPLNYLLYFRFLKVTIVAVSLTYINTRVQLGNFERGAQVYVLCITGRVRKYMALAQVENVLRLNLKNILLPKFAL